MAEYTWRKVMYLLGVAPYALQDSWINKNDFRKSGWTRKKTGSKSYLNAKDIKNCVKQSYLYLRYPALYSYYPQHLSSWRRGWIETGFSCRFGAYPGTHSVDQTGLKHRDLPVSVPWVLGLKACHLHPAYKTFLKSIKASTASMLFREPELYGYNNLYLSTVIQFP